MIDFEATYSAQDDKIRIRASARLDPEVYQRVKSAGFGWAPKQDCFFAVWTPEREDLAIELAGDIEEEETTREERAEVRAERFAGYRARRAADAEQARKAVAAIADGIPLGQPILVGHHSERHARRDAERIENGMRKAVKAWETSEYWQRRAAACKSHAAYLEKPDVRARRIKGLEADERKHAKALADSEKFVKAWQRLDDPTFLKLKAGGATTPVQKAVYLADCDWRVAHLSTSEIRDGKITPEQARDRALAAHGPIMAHHRRWLEHTRNRLTFERAMLDEAGGLPTDKTKPEVGGAIRCWCCKHPGMWMLIQKVNKVSVTVSDTWKRGDLFSRKIKLDEITGVMSAADVADKLADGSAVKSDDGRCIIIQAAPLEAPEPAKPEATEAPADIAAMKASLKAGVQAVAAPCLFPTPPELARRMAGLAAKGGTLAGKRVLEPSAGTGNLIKAAVDNALGFDCGIRITAVEINTALLTQLEGRRRRWLYANPDNFEIVQGDFLMCVPGVAPTEASTNVYHALPDFHAILMNPPFDHGLDITHIKHALQFLKPGGRLVAICANGPRQKAELEPMAETWEELPAGTFTGTNVRSVLLMIQK